ncbi:hypothetical protein JYT90_00400 [bacterium AH-315-P07]|nr:hypothetical protein [bacterium AH-315-P07]
MHRYQTITVALIAVLSGALTYPVSRAAESETSVSMFSLHHRTWASSLAGDAVKADVWISKSGLLDARELFRQLEIDGEIRIVDSETSSDESAAIVKRLARREVLLCSRSAWIQLLADEKRAVQNRVQEGMGLVLIGLGDPRAFEDERSAWEASEAVAFLDSAYSMPGEHLPRDVSGAWTTFTAQEGRIAVFRSEYFSETQELVPLDAFGFLEQSLLYEYHLASLARAVLWASQHVHGSRIVGITRAPANEPDPREIPPHLPVEFTKYMLDGRIKTLTKDVILRLNRPASRNYEIDVRVRQPHLESPIVFRARESFRKGIQEVMLHLPVGKGESWIDLWVMEGKDVLDWYSYSETVEEWPTLSNVEFSKQIVAPNDSIEVTFSVDRNSNKPARTHAFIVVTDALGRVRAEKRVVIDEDAGDIHSMVNWTDVRTTQLKIEVFLVPGQIVSISEWSKKSAGYAITRLPVTRLPQAGLRWIVKGQSLAEPWALAVNRTLAGMGVNTIELPRISVPGPGALGSNLSTVSRLDFRKLSHGADFTSSNFRQNLYDSISHWSSWSTARGTQELFLGDARAFFPGDWSNCTTPRCLDFLRKKLQSYYPSLKLLNTNWNTQFSSWREVIPPNEISVGTPVAVDLLRVSSAVGLQVIDEARNHLSRKDPVPSMGLWNIEENFGDSAAFLGELIPELSLIAISTEELLTEKVRSYQSVDAVTGLKLNGQDFGMMRRSLWTALFHQMATVWSGGVDDAGRIADHTAALGHAIDEVRHGLDVLLHAAEPYPATVAIYENAASQYASTLDERRARDTSQLVVVRKLKELGLPFEFATYADLMDSGLSEYDVVVLPRVVSMSDEEEILFKRFSDAGGVLVSVGRTSVTDEHGASRRDSGLAAAISRSIVDDSDIPAMLDDVATQFDSERLYNDFLDVGEAPEALSWFRYRYGKAELIGVLGGSTKAKRPLIKFSDGMAVYDTLHGRLLKSSRARISFNDAGAGILSVLPYRVSRIILTSANMVETGRRLQFGLQLKTFDALPGEHLVHVELHDQEGRSIRIYETNVECPDGKGEGYLLVPINEKVGSYTLVVRDVMTGITTSKDIEIVSISNP